GGVHAQLGSLMSVYSVKRCNASGFTFVFFQAEDGIRAATVTGVQTCALPISPFAGSVPRHDIDTLPANGGGQRWIYSDPAQPFQIGRASCRERVEGAGSAGHVKKRAIGETSRTGHQRSVCVTDERKMQTARVL